MLCKFSNYKLAQNNPFILLKKMKKSLLAEQNKTHTKKLFFQIFSSKNISYFFDRRNVVSSIFGFDSFDFVVVREHGFVVGQSDVFKIKFKKSHEREREEKCVVRRSQSCKKINLFIFKTVNQSSIYLKVCVTSIYNNCIGIHSGTQLMPSVGFLSKNW